MTTEVVRCDGCREPGRRRADQMAPDFWFYIESVDDKNPRRVYIVWACSEKCRDAVWKRGPGPSGLAGARRIHGRQQTTHDVAAIVLTSEDRRLLQHARGLMLLASATGAATLDPDEKSALELVQYLIGAPAVDADPGTGTH